MEANKSTFTHRTPEEIRAWFNRAKVRQQQLEEEGRRMWEEGTPKKLKLEDLEIPAKLRRKRGCIRLTEEDLKDEQIQYILKK